MPSLADRFVALVALLLGLMFLATAFGQWTGFDRLNWVQRVHARRGRRTARRIHFFIGCMLLTAGIAIFFGWRVLPAGPAP